VRRDVLGEPPGETPEEIRRGPWVRRLLAEQAADGGFGGHPYAKWGGAHWRLVSLVELGIAGPDEAAVSAARTVVRWLNGEGHLGAMPVIRGRARRHASQEGNALAVCTRLGVAIEPDVAAIADRLVGWQWPDGGWNCDRHPEAHHSSVNESLPPIWGLHEYAAITGDARARDAALRGAEFLLDHRVFRSHTAGKVMHRRVVDIHWPAYWHYDILQALLVLSRVGCARDARVADALDVLESKRAADGRWEPDGRWWRGPGSKGSGVEAVDWGRDGERRMLSLNAMRVLVAAGWRTPLSGSL
jgi:hypothetical protein